MTRTSGFTAMIVAAVLSASPGTGFAAAHVLLTASHQSISVTGVDFPTTGQTFYVDVYGGPNRIYVASGNAVPNKQALASPPCFIVCDKGEFYLTFQQTSDPCLGSGGYKRIGVYWGTNRKPDRWTWTTVSCPVLGQ